MVNTRSGVIWILFEILKNQFDVTIAVYQVSGEYAMVKAARKGLDRYDCVMFDTINWPNNEAWLYYYYELPLQKDAVGFGCYKPPSPLSLCSAATPKG